VCISVDDVLHNCVQAMASSLIHLCSTSLNFSSMNLLASLVVIIQQQLSSRVMFSTGHPSGQANQAWFRLDN
jgi:hypothetical protein